MAVEHCDAWGGLYGSNQRRDTRPLIVHESIQQESMNVSNWRNDYVSPEYVTGAVSAASHDGLAYLDFDLSGSIIRVQSPRIPPNKRRTGRHALWHGCRSSRRRAGVAEPLALHKALCALVPPLVPSDMGCYSWENGWRHREALRRPPGGQQIAAWRNASRGAHWVLSPTSSLQTWPLELLPGSFCLGMLMEASFICMNFMSISWRSEFQLPSSSGPGKGCIGWHRCRWPTPYILFLRHVFIVY